MRYETEDIVLAAYLMSQDPSHYRVDDIKMGGNMKGIFVFNNIDQEVVDNFMLAKGTVEPIKFNTNLRQLVTAVRLKSNRN